jgi:hypothetical protein
LVMELLWHFKDERRFIWKWVGHFLSSKHYLTYRIRTPYSAVKLVYLVSRYLALVSQLYVPLSNKSPLPFTRNWRVNILLVSLALRSPPAPSRVCRAWLIFQYGITLSMGTLLQEVLLLRRKDRFSGSRIVTWATGFAVCALYLHTLNIRAASLLMFFAQRITSIAVLLHFTLFQATFDSKCSCQVSTANILNSYGVSPTRVCCVLILDQN